MVQLIENMPHTAVDFAEVAKQVAEKRWPSVPAAIGFRSKPSGSVDLELVLQIMPPGNVLAVTKVTWSSGDTPEHCASTAKATAILEDGVKTYQLRKPANMQVQKFPKAFAYLLQRMGGRCLLLGQTIHALGRGTGRKSRLCIRKLMPTSGKNDRRTMSRTLWSFW